MTHARHLTFAEGQQGLYHCIARCVRRAWLCGVDPVTKVDYEHRKPMIAARIVQLAGIFAVDVYSYAVMSNHLHVVLSIEPAAAREWSDEEVARRWVQVVSGMRAGADRGQDQRAVRVMYSSRQGKSLHTANRPAVTESEARPWNKWLNLPGRTVLSKVGNSMTRHVLSLDETNNCPDGGYTKIQRLFRTLRRNQQLLSYYQPGVGALEPGSVVSAFAWMQREAQADGLTFKPEVSASQFGDLQVSDDSALLKTLSTTHAAAPLHDELRLRLRRPIEYLPIRRMRRERRSGDDGETEEIWRREWHINRGNSRRPHSDVCPLVHESVQGRMRGGYRPLAELHDPMFVE